VTRVPVDQAARDLISIDGLGETLFVDAGAGTGKTKSLVDRIVNLVSRSDLRLERVAAITFTEAAAAELRDRIRTELDDRLDDETDDTVRTRLQQALDDTDVAAISTLHSFCLRILNEHPIDIGLPPRVEILDEVTSQLEAEERWGRFIDEIFSDPATEGVVIRANTLGINIDRRPNTASLRDVSAVFDNNWDRLDGVPDMDPAMVDPDFTRFVAAVDALEAQLPRCTDHDDGFYEKVCGYLPRLREIAGEPDIDRALRLLDDESWGPGNRGAKKNWDDDIASAKDALAEVREAADAVKAAQSDAVLERLASRLAKFVRESADARRASGRLEYHDLLVLARQLLRTSTSARHALHRRYERLLLDEFQDTDPIQIEVATLIASAVDTEAVPAKWEDADVVRGRLFCVGDPKQSIYRFRRADVSLFDRARTAFGGERPVQLVQNFRTVPSIVAWVNELFGELMPGGDESRQPAYVPLSAHRDDSALDHRVMVLGGPTEARAGDIREAEAAEVAAVVADIHRAPESWKIARKDPDGHEPWEAPRLSDITILLPTRTSLHMLETALDAEEIPYRVDTGTLVYGTQEVRDLLAIITVVDDPTHELALVTALRSPLYACSDRDLFEYKQAGGRWELRRRHPDGLDPEHPVLASLDHLEVLWSGRSWTEPSALIDRLLRDRRAFVLANSHRRPREVWRRYRFVLDQARLFAESGGGDLRRFVQWASLQAADGSRIHEPLLPETDDDAVRILTIHGSKGLEFPITILSGMSTELGRGRAGVAVHWDENDRPAVKMKKGIETADFDRLALLEQEMGIDESRRLLYVAATRARDHLVVSAHHPVGKHKVPESHGKWVWNHGPSVEAGGARGFARSPRISAAAQPEMVSPPPDDRVEWATRRAALLAGTDQSVVMSATAIATMEDEPQVTQPDEDRGDAESAESAERTTWRKGRAGSAIGRAVHASLQLVDLSRADEQVPVLASQQAHLEAIEAHTDTVAAMIRSALAAPLVAQGLAGRHWRELYVAAPVGERVIEGYVDLLVERHDGLVVVDYKTDTVRSDAEVDAKLAHYALQAASYAVAIEASTGRPVVAAGFVFCRPHGAIERMVDDLGAAKAEVRARLGA